MDRFDKILVVMWLICSAIFLFGSIDTFGKHNWPGFSWNLIGVCIYTGLPISKYYNVKKRSL